jgi:hypothetical protein
LAFDVSEERLFFGIQETSEKKYLNTFLFTPNFKTVTTKTSKPDDVKAARILIEILGKSWCCGCAMWLYAGLPREIYLPDWVGKNSENEFTPP